jgi:hypothetical protein
MEAKEKTNSVNTKIKRKSAKDKGQLSAPKIDEGLEGVGVTIKSPEGQKEVGNLEKDIPDLMETISKPPEDEKEKGSVFSFVFFSYCIKRNFFIYKKTIDV